MGSPQIQGNGMAGGVRALLLAGLVAALLQPLATRAEMPVPAKRGAGFKGATGSVVQYQEAAGARILYLEEKGGILLPVAPAVPGSRRDDLPPVASASAPAGAASGAAARKAAAPAGAIARP